MKIFAYLKSTMRLASAIFISILALALVFGGGLFAYNKWEKSKAKEYEAVKQWTVDLQSFLQFSLVAQTKLVDERFLMMVNTDAYPQYLKDPRQSAKNTNRIILLNFVDKDGFKVFSKSIAVKDFSTTVDGTGTPIGMSFEASDYMDVRTYSSMSKLNVEWTVDTVIPAAAPLSIVPTKDHCAPNLSKDERLRRLGEYGIVRQTGEGSYAVGSHSLMFLSYNNSLLDCH
jgi:hypothetical protein